MVRRVLPLTLSMGLLFTLGMARTDSASAQEVKKETPKAEAPKVEEPKKAEVKGDTAKKEEAAKKEPEKAVEAPPPTVPKAVEEKLEAARAPSPRPSWPPRTPAWSTPRSTRRRSSTS